MKCLGSRESRIYHPQSTAKIPVKKHGIYIHVRKHIFQKSFKGPAGFMFILKTLFTSFSERKQYLDFHHFVLREIFFITILQPK